MLCTCMAASTAESPARFSAACGAKALPGHQPHLQCTDVAHSQSRQTNTSFNDTCCAVISTSLGMRAVQVTQVGQWHTPAAALVPPPCIYAT